MFLLFASYLDSFSVTLGMNTASREIEKLFPREIIPTRSAVRSTPLSLSSFMSCRIQVRKRGREFYR